MPPDLEEQPVRPPLGSKEGPILSVTDAVVVAAAVDVMMMMHAGKDALLI
jgi:hypothetical protein